MTRRSRQRFVAGTLTLLFAILSATCARADGLLVLSRPSCGRAPYATLWEQLTIELRAEGFSVVDDASLPADGGPSAADIEVRLHLEPCIAQPRNINVLATTRSSNLWQTRVVPLADFDVTQPRLLALTIAEFVRGAYRDMVMSPRRPNETGDVADDGDRATTVGIEQPASPSPSSNDAPVSDDFARIGIGLALDSRYFPSQSTSLIGPRAVGWLPLGGRAVMHLEGGIGWGTAEDRLGTVDFSDLTVSLGLDLATTGRDLRFQLGPRLALGEVNASAQPKQGAKAESAHATIALAGFGATLIGRIEPRWIGWLTIEAEQTLHGVRLRADQRSPAGFAGPVVGLQLGFARSL